MHSSCTALGSFQIIIVPHIKECYIKILNKRSDDERGLVLSWQSSEQDIMLKFHVGNLHVHTSSMYCIYVHNSEMIYIYVCSCSLTGRIYGGTWNLYYTLITWRTLVLTTETF